MEEREDDNAEVVAVDDVRAAAEEFARGLVGAFGLQATTSSMVEGNEIEVRVDSGGDGLGLLIGPSGRESQSDDWSAKAPDERMRPPSEPSNTWVGLLGLTTSECWSGCSALAAHGRGSQQFAGSFGCMVLSAVRSLHVWPAFVEYRTARPLLENPYSPYWKEPRT